MISARRRFSAFSTATPLLRASCWKTPLPGQQARRVLVPIPLLDASVAYGRTAGYSSIADAMLGRAVQSFQPPPQRKEAVAAAATAKGTKSPGSSQGVDDMLKNGKKDNSRKSISGWARPVSPGPTIVSSAPVFARTNSASAFSRPTTAGTVTSNGYAETSSAMRGFSAGPGRQGSVVDKVVTKAAVVINAGPDIVDLTDEAPSKSHAPQPVEFDFDDFDDDSDLDLEVEYPLALPTLTSMPPPKLSATPQHLVNPSSGAIPWSSSPQAHLAPPPGAGAKRSSFQEPEPITNLISSEPSIDANPRPAKRRTTPWAQRAAEEKETQSQPRDQVPSGTKCFKCHGYGHYSGSCTRERPSVTSNQQDEDSFTPLPKEKSLPWNTTASAIKDKRGAFKEQQKSLRAKRENSAITDMFKSTTKGTTKTDKSDKPGNIFLSGEQSNVLELVTQQKKSVFFTGSAGTGKSVLMRAIIAELRKVYKREPDRVAVTASTGLAACNIGGVTLHSFGGIGLGKEPVPDLVKKIMRNQKAKNRWLRTKVLIVDEVSMVDGELFDKLEGIARFIRKNGRPFGGIQLVVTGDFFQLPPVPDYGKQVKFAFDADTWSTSIHHTIGLTEVFRQRDPEFANMLNEMRLGKISDATMKNFRKLDRPLEASGLDATELFPTRNEVENSNFMKMRQLKGSGKLYLAEDTGTVRDPQQLERLCQNFMAPKKLELKKHAQVMLIKNMDDNLVNGSIGKVIGFMNEKTFEVYEGVDLDPLDDAGSDGDEHDATREAKRRVRGMMNKDLIADTGKEYPLVRFFAADGTSRDLLCQPEDWKVELPNGEVQAQRRQIPLILAWALSIHKAQGQTLERVKVDLRKVFENGQAYVALSRATTQEGLWVQNFNPRAVMAHPRVGEFYDSLYSVNKAMKHPKVQPPAKKKKEVDLEEWMEEGGREPIKELENWDDEEEAMAAYG
ncbi:hypothetical protein V490_01914 [Pseudogymnoascus sp. VKM F-3557]|nr:hypothetical protein V490_01914 [Pseudogymnoascus sp. VKM F-3557]